jgi:hypothetical protein
MNNIIHLGAHAEFTLAICVLNNEEYTVLYHNDHIAGMMHHFQNQDRIFFDETLVDLLFNDPATEFPDFINYMRNDNNNAPIEGLAEAYAYCHEALFELQMTYDPVIEFTEDLIQLELDAEPLLDLTEDEMTALMNE